MTLSTSQNTKLYTGDNLTVAFAFPYLFYANSHLRVTVDGDVKVLATDYNVTGAGNEAGGTVTFNSAPATSAAIVIQRIVDYVQETDFENFDGNPADVTERQFDLLTMQTQQLAEIVQRSVVTPIGTTLSTNILSGTIDSTVRALTITTSGISTSLLSVINDAIDTVITNATAGDLLKYDGSNWVNVDEIEVANIDALTASGFALRNVNGTPCVTIGAGTNNNFRAEVNLNMNSKKITNLLDPTSAQDGATKAYVDAQTTSGWIPLQTQTVSSPVASVDFTSGIDGTYNTYVVVFTGGRVSVDNSPIYIRLGNGGSFDSGASDYEFLSYAIEVSSNSAANSANSSFINLGFAVGNATGEFFEGEILLFDPSNTGQHTNLSFKQTVIQASGAGGISFGFGRRKEAAAHDRIQFFPASGNITAGTFTIYGRAGA